MSNRIVQNIVMESLKDCQRMRFQLCNHSRLEAFKLVPANTGIAIPTYKSFLASHFVFRIWDFPQFQLFHFIVGC